MPLGVAQRAMMGAGAGLVDPFMEEIETVTLASAAASVTFSGIDSAFRMFQLTGMVVKDGTASTVKMTINNDSGTNYNRQQLLGSSTTVAGSRSTGGTSIDHGVAGANEALTFSAAIAKQLAASPAMVLSDVVYNSSGVKKHNNGAIWDNTADLISRLDFILDAGNFVANTELTLNGDQSVSI